VGSAGRFLCQFFVVLKRRRERARVYSLLNSNVKLLALWLEGKEERQPSESIRTEVSTS